jgi:two-component system, OmpR family, sensor histidine kinase MprB
MSLRRRIAITAAAAVAVAVALGSVVAYVVVRDTLRGQIDDSLRTAARMAPIDGAEGGARLSTRTSPEQGRRGPAGDELMLQALQGPVLFTQLLRADAAGERPLPGGPGPLVSVADLRALSAGTRAPFFTERDYKGTRLRVYAAPVERSGAIVVARPLTEVQSVLSTLRVGLGLVIVAGIALALLLGRLATRAAVKPVADLTETAEHVARTRDLTRRIATEGDDELSRLAASFNTMLEALEASRQAQRQLVADASHELRTPLTSLRTNLEVLGTGRDLEVGDRERLRRDVVAQLEELGELVGDLVELARDGEVPGDPPEPLRFDELVAAAVERAQRHAPQVAFTTDLETCVVTGERARLDRAVANLLDNAAKWSPPGGTVEVVLRDGELTVRDHGPGIADEDAPFVFDRFYRAPSARGMPGSGLGLAIVRQVAEAHGGGVAARNAADGGAELCLRLAPAERYDGKSSI